MRPTEDCLQQRNDDVDLVIPSFLVRDRIASLMSARPHHFFAERTSSKSLTPRRHRARTSTVVVIFAAVVLSLIPLATSGAATQANAINSAQDRVARASQARLQAESILADAAAKLEEQAAIASDLQNLSEDLTVQITAAKTDLQDYMIAAYIDGGERDAYRSMLSPFGDATEQWGIGLLEIQSEEARRSAARYADMKSSVDPEYVEAANVLATLNAAYESARNDAIQAAALERTAEKELAAAQEAQRQREAEAARKRAAQVAAQAAEQRQVAQQAEANRQAQQRATSRSETRSTAPAKPTAVPAVTQEVREESPQPATSGAVRGSPTERERATLARIRACESGGNYSIVSASGRYRGAYQFDYQTWASMGGSGDPAAASPSEQDYRALLLLRQRGTRPWPTCGA